MLQRPPPPTAARRPRRGLFIGLARFALLTATLSLISGAWLLQISRHRASLRHFDKVNSPGFAARQAPRLSREQFLLLGSAQVPENRPGNSYLSFSERKPAGTYRIGVFGCSFVFGSEVPEGRDFPTLLQRDLARSGRPGVEVLNFGVGGYGLHQSYLLWSFLAERYELDYVIFNLYSFHRKRDASFLHRPDEYGPVHARYVLGDDDLVLIRPDGEDRRQAARRYHSLFPSWRYLRYDVHAPTVLRVWLGRGETLRRNPFYYSADPQREMDEIYRRLFTTVAERSNGLFLVCNDTGSCDFVGDSANPNQALGGGRAASLSWRFPELYRARENHLSSLGNELVARELTAILNGTSPMSLPLLERAELPPSASGPHPSASEADRGLAAASEIFLAIGDHPVAQLVEPTSVAPGAPLRRVDFAGRGIVSLVDLSTTSELRFLPVLRPLATREPLTLVIHEPTGGATQVPIGELIDEVPFFARPSLRRSLRQGRWTVTSDGRDPGSLTVSGGRALRASVLVSGDELLRGEAVASADGGYRFVLEPASGSVLMVRAHRRQRVDVTDLPRHGSMDLRVKLGHWVTVPLVGYRIGEDRVEGMSTGRPPGFTAGSPKP